MFGARLLNVIKAIGLVFVIPLTALIVSYFVSIQYDSEFRSALSQYAQEQNQQVDLSTVEDYRVICSRNDPDFSGICGPASELSLFETGSKVSLLVGASLFIILLLGRVIAGSDRRRLALVLSPLTRIILLGLSISIVLQGALLVYGIYIAEAVFVGRVHFIALGGAALVALLGGFSLIWISLRLMKNASISQSGILVDRSNGQNLINFVNEVADRVGAARPDNVVVGLEPSFYVTAAKLSLNGATDVMDGTTLYMPLPFLRILSRAELRSVIGHEMGHFKGNDTEYSLRFYPAYSRLGSAIQTLAGDGEENTFVNIPTLAFLVLLHDEFSGIERKIGREREISADLEGAKVGSAKSLATALLKFSEYAELWGPIRQFNIESLNEGKIFDDICDLYFHVSVNNHTEMDFASKLDGFLAYEMTHPNDTHPTLRERLLALGIDPASLTKEDLAPADNAVSELLNGYDEVSQELSVAEHRLMIGLGYASLPQRDDE